MVSILFTAFGSDELLVGTCYPDTALNRAWWERNLTSQISDSSTRVYKVIDGDRLVSWAKWLVTRKVHEIQSEGRPPDKGKGAVNPDDEPSLDMNLMACRNLAEAQYKMREDVLLGRDHYCTSLPGQCLANQQPIDFLRAQCNSNRSCVLATRRPDGACDIWHTTGG